MEDRASDSEKGCRLKKGEKIERVCCGLTLFGECINWGENSYGKYTY